VAFASFAVAMGSSFAVQPLRELWPQDTVNGKISSTPPERRSLHARGYLATYALELGSGYPWRMQKQTQPMESPHGVENLPLLPCTDKIVLIQVEALDYEMLTEKARAEYVMPFLHNLLDHAVLLRLDGTKKMASANSDYEVFTGRIASHSILHYEYETDYSGSFLRFLTQKISPSYSFHGMPGNYMNQEVAYRRQGVQYVYGLEKMQAEGVPAVAIWTDGIAADTDLLGFAAKKFPSRDLFYILSSRWTCTSWTSRKWSAMPCNFRMNHATSITRCADTSTPPLPPIYGNCPKEPLWPYGAATDRIPAKPPATFPFCFSSQGNHILVCMNLPRH